MYVIGTAGHVDHGKSTLVRALTGIDPDRLKEERAREMTIDLGFAWLDLFPGQAPVGIIDVPGHRDFIENMLAGVGGIHAVLFVVAADEGVMPQTREHLAIIDLLRIPTGLIVLTKTDLAPDHDWIELVQLDLGEVVQGTVLQGAPIIPVSARQGQGLDLLRERLASTLRTLPAPVNVGRPRLWVDRVFSISGFGTVVTGTLLDGEIPLGQEVEFQPGGLRGRVRGLQSHHQTLEIAQPGSRVAINVSGIDRQQAHRGMLLTLPGAVQPATLTTVQFRHLPDAPRPLRHNAEIKFFCGSAETVARVRLLDTQEMLMPGAEGWLQLELRDPVPLFKGDRFILRYPSPGDTIGGGDVIEPTPGKRWRRNRPEVLARLEALAAGDPLKLVTQALTKPLSAARIAAQTALDAQTVAETLQNAHAQQLVVALSGERWIEANALSGLLARLTNTLAVFHRAEPLRLGMRPERLRGLLSLEPADFEAILEVAQANDLVTITVNVVGTLIAARSHTIRWTRTQRAALDKLTAAFAAAPYTPPSYKDAVSIAGQDVVESLVEQAELRLISPEVLFTPAALADVVAETRRALAAEGKITVKILRDRFNTSRKYALAALEYFDNLGITRRSGDDHVLASGDWAKAGFAV